MNREAFFKWKAERNLQQSHMSTHQLFGRWCLCISQWLTLVSSLTTDSAAHSGWKVNGGDYLDTCHFSYLDLTFVAEEVFTAHLFSSITASLAGDEGKVIQKVSFSFVSVQTLQSSLALRWRLLRVVILLSKRKKINPISTSVYIKISHIHY